jgi:asparagine synthase (glutamine-hydrolysing)
MCGISGVFSLTASPQRQLRNVLRMTKAMRHRGPDDEGYAIVGRDRLVHSIVGEDTPAAVRVALPKSRPIQSAFDKATTLALGHRRLSILDPTPAGHQPMSDPTGRYWIVFNGEIYNFRELRLELEALGHSFSTASDTEVILAAYSRWQEGCLQRFNGAFSFALWDNQEQSLFCARDRIGIKPFYYNLDGERFVFASDIKALIASGLYLPEPDPQGLYLAMAFGIAPRPITAFKGIRALEQSHWMRLHANGRIEKERYWRIPIGAQCLQMTEADATELLEEQLQRAVARRLVSDVTVGTFMSGGVDSTTISAMAAHQHPGIKAFTLGYQGNAPELDEVPQAKATARLHPLRHIVERVDPNLSLADLPDWILGYEEPYYSLAANSVISKLVKDNQVTVVLNGLGGDELFAGYGYYRYCNLPRMPWLNPLFRYADRIPARRLAKGLSLLGAQTADRSHTLLFQKTSDRYLRQLFVPAFHPPANTPDLLHDLYARDLRFSDAMEAMSYMDMMNCIGNHHVHRIDQFTMAHSVEGRFPFLDHELIEAAYRIPSHFKIRAGEQKYVLRRVAEKYIAPECLAMKKKGFGLPLSQWMRGPLKPLIQSSLSQLKQRSEINSMAVSACLAAYEEGRLRPERVWHLVALELWFRSFIDPGVPQGLTIAKPRIKLTGW